MPDPLSLRLDALVDLLEDNGVSTSRTELINAAVLALPTSPTMLERVVVQFRSTSSGESLVPARMSGLIPSRVKRPGPRPIGR